MQKEKKMFKFKSPIMFYIIFYLLTHSLYHQSKAFTYLTHVFGVDQLLCSLAAV